MLDIYSRMLSHTAEQLLFYFIRVEVPDRLATWLALLSPRGDSFQRKREKKGNAEGGKQFIHGFHWTFSFKSYSTDPNLLLKKETA